MPELPEMETYRMLMSPRLVGHSITAVTITRPKSINTTEERFRQLVESQRLTAITRCAKHLLFHLENGYVLLLHLMLGGMMYIGHEDDKPDRTTQIVLTFDHCSLYFIGLRLGYLHVLHREEAEEKMAAFGPNPLDAAFDMQQLRTCLERRRTVIKTALLDQHTIAGIGNCYADEICFMARLSPFYPIQQLDDDDYSRLHQAMQQVLRSAIAYGGYMEMPLYAGDMKTGGYNDRCLVYDRGGEPCFNCGTPIAHAELSSRHVYFCPRCQP